MMAKEILCGFDLKIQSIRYCRSPRTLRVKPTIAAEQKWN